MEKNIEHVVDWEAIAAAIGVPSSGQSSTKAYLASHYSRKQSLLVISQEHLTGKLISSQEHKPGYDSVLHAADRKFSF